MAKTQKNAIPEGFQTRRPGEVVVVADGTDVPTGGHVIVADRAMRRGYLDLPSYALKPGVSYVLPTRVLARGTDGAEMVRAGRLRVVDEAAGLLPQMFDASHSHERAKIRDGKAPEPSKQDRIVHWRGIVIDGSLATSIVEVLDALGLPDDLHNEKVAELVKDLCATYDRAGLERRLRQQPWRERSQELIAIGLAKQAGLTEGSE